MRLIFLVLLYSLPLACRSQEGMALGFKMLEAGNFEEATTFFESYLSDHPENKTAQICYGRAIGLSGAPEKANALFGRLAEEYPNDFEVAINYNESFLWAKEYKTAKPLYEKLVSNYPTKFGAILGYANTLSNLKEYRAALEWINKALVLQPENESAKVSRKYIELGYANAYVTGQDYENGKKYLNEIFSDFPEDKDALLNLANLYLITKETDNAEATYWRYATSPKDSITALNGIVLAEHIAGNDKLALQFAKVAINRVAAFSDSGLTESTYDRYVQALIWNRKYKTARQRIDSLQAVQGEKNFILGLQATLGMYTGDFKSSLQKYTTILENDSTSFDGNLGKANALFASDRIIPAYAAAFQTLTIFENQKDAMGFIEKLNAIHLPTVQEHAAYTFDNGNNIAFANTLTAIIPFSTKFKTSVSYQYRTTENTVTQNRAASHIALIGTDITLYPKVHLKTVAGLNNSRFMETAYTQPIFEAKLALKPYKLQDLELRYQREVQNFNADLIEREIVLNHYGLNYNLGTNVNLGWYTQLMHTLQSDENTRDLLFTSLYYTVLQKPALKLGLNYQYISFSEQVPNIYFSPERYRAGEVFADIRGSISEKTNYIASAATGLQKVEDDIQTTIFRAEAALQHQFGKRLSANVYGKYSNIASVTAAGFVFTEMGVKLKWALKSTPLFYGNLR